jgi:hypothetical protein
MTIINMCTICCERLPQQSRHLVRAVCAGGSMTQAGVLQAGMVHVEASLTR